MKRRINEFTEPDPAMSDVAGRPVICVPIEEVRLGSFTRPITKLIDSPNDCLREAAQKIGKHDVLVKPVKTGKRQGWQAFCRTTIVSRLLNIPGMGTVRQVKKRNAGQGRLFMA